MTARPPRALRLPLDRATRSCKLLAALLLAGFAAACCVAPPQPGTWLSIGFRTPEQAFHTFQTAVRAEDPGFLRRCLSSGFLRDNQLSEIAFRESWERLLAAEPLLRKGLADAEPLGAAEVKNGRALIVARTHGKRLRIAFVREDFCEAWEGGERRIDEAADFRDRSGTQPAADGTAWVYGRMPVPQGVSAERLTELRVGREWKIDGFEIVEARADGPRSAP